MPRGFIVVSFPLGGDVGCSVSEADYPFRCAAVGYRVLGEGRVTGVRMDPLVDRRPVGSRQELREGHAFRRQVRCVANTWPTADADV